MRKLIGQGRGGCVFSTEESSTVIKVILDDQDARNELDILQKLAHIHIVELLSYSTHENNLLLEFSRYDCSLKEYVWPLGIDRLRAIRFMSQLLQGLAECHRVGIMHRDIRPDNILVNKALDNVVLADFGSAKKMVHGRANTLEVVAFRYRGPEILLKQDVYYTEKIDVWSTGCLFPEMLCGCQFFHVATEQQVVQRMEEFLLQENQCPFSIHSTERVCWLPMMLEDATKRVSSSRAAEQWKELDHKSKYYHHHHAAPV